jgi:hypothetical protein
VEERALFFDSAGKSYTSQFESVTGYVPITEIVTIDWVRRRYCSMGRDRGRLL